MCFQSVSISFVNFTDVVSIPPKCIQHVRLQLSGKHSHMHQLKVYIKNWLLRMIMDRANVSYFLTMFVQKYHNNFTTKAILRHSRIEKNKVFSSCCSQWKIFNCRCKTVELWQRNKNLHQISGTEVVKIREWCEICVWLVINEKFR